MSFDAMRGFPAPETAITFVPWVSAEAGAIVSPAVPVKRTRRKSMSRRAGQSGHVEVSGHWWVVRYWMDVPGQDRRKHMSTKICRTNGLGKMTKPERERRAMEIVAQSGANTAECLAVAEASFGVTFRRQAEQWLKDCATRKRDPIKPATLSSWENCIKVWLNPNLGDTLLSTVNNAAMKTLVAKMAEA